MSDSRLFPVFVVCLAPSISAAEWSQTLLYRNEKEPLHLQGHKGHLPGFHREAGLFHVQLFCSRCVKSQFYLERLFGKCSVFCMTESKLECFFHFLILGLYLERVQLRVFFFFLSYPDQKLSKQIETKGLLCLIDCVVATCVV